MKHSDLRKVKTLFKEVDKNFSRNLLDKKRRHLELRQIKKLFKEVDKIFSRNLLDK